MTTHQQITTQFRWPTLQRVRGGEVLSAAQLLTGNTIPYNPLMSISSRCPLLNQTNLPPRRAGHRSFWVCMDRSISTEVIPCNTSKLWITNQLWRVGNVSRLQTTSHLPRSVLHTLSAQVSQARTYTHQNHAHLATPQVAKMCPVIT